MKNIGKKYRGFSLVEMMISIMIFTVIILVALAVFLRISSVKSKARAVQQNIEDARYGTELMAKTIRTSSVLDPLPSAIDPKTGLTVSLLKIFDYSQNRCIQYEFSAENKLTERSVVLGAVADCGAYDLSGEKAHDLIANYVSSGNFFVIPSSAGVAGRVTMTMEVCDTLDCPTSKDGATIQTSVSLRDYDIQTP